MQQPHPHPQPENDPSDECSICTDKYTPDTNIPLLLQCGHTFCHKCVQQTLAVTVPHNTTSKTPQQQNKNSNTNCVECMVCKQTTALSTDDSSAIETRLAHNIALIAQIAAKRADAQQKPVCENCERQGAEVFCQVCNHNVCSACFDQAHSAKVMKAHRATPLANKHLEMCLVHNQKLCVVCVECGDKPICSECVHAKCRNHTTRDFASVVQDKAASVHKLHEDMQKHMQHLDKLLGNAKQTIHQVAQEKEEMIANITTAMNKVRVAVDRAQQELVDQACKLFDGKQKNFDCHAQHLKIIRECVGALVTSKQHLPRNQANNQIQDVGLTSLAQECTALTSWVARATNVNQQCTQLCQQSSQPAQSLIFLTTTHMSAMCNDLEQVLLRTKVASLVCVDPSPQSQTIATTSSSIVVFGTTPRWKTAQCVATSTTSVRLVWESGLGMRGEGAKQAGLQFRVVLKESIPHDDVRDKAKPGQGSCNAAQLVRRLCVGGADERVTHQQHAEEGGKIVFEGKANECDVTNLADKHHHVFELCEVYRDCTPPMRVVCADKIVVCTPYCWLEFESISTDGVELTNHRRKLKHATNGSPQFGIGQELPQKKIVRWKLRIVKSSSSIFCGIISTNTQGNDSYSSESSFTWYSLGCSYPCGKFAKCERWVGWRSGDEAVMTLDGVKHTLTVEHSRCAGTPFTMDITRNLCYRIHVCVCDQDDCVELVEGSVKEAWGMLEIGRDV